MPPVNDSIGDGFGAAGFSTRACSNLAASSMKTASGLLIELMLKAFCVPRIQDAGPAFGETLFQTHPPLPQIWNLQPPGRICLMKNISAKNFVFAWPVDILRLLRQFPHT